MLLSAVLAFPHSVSAQTSPGAAAATPLLGMPFVPQSEVLCGGAALAMVLRHHGVRGVQAEDFAHLVVDSMSGIRTTDLTAAARERGVDATPFSGMNEIVRALLAAGDPVIALIEDRPGVYHYVVLLAWGDGRVVLHDPAIGPHQVMSEAELMRAWQPTAYWALRMGPRHTSVSAETAHPEAGNVAGVSGRASNAGTERDPARSDTIHPGDTIDTVGRDDRCGVHMRTAAEAAAANDLAAAERSLEDAARLCADPTLVARERAGLWFRQQRYDEAEAAVLRRLRHASGDAYAWELLGAIRFVRGEQDGALSAWNRIDRPVSDLTRIDGLRRTPYAIVNDAVGIAPGTLVSRRAIEHARRRVGALPAIARARVDFRPVSRDTAQVGVAVLEHAVLPLGAFDLALHGVRALAERRVLVQPANVLRLGERWRVGGSWQENRRALQLGVSVPRVLGLRAVTHVDALAREWTFANAGANAAAATPRSESVRSISLGVSDWATPAVSWEAHAGMQRWNDGNTHGVVDAGAALHLHQDRVVLAGDLSGWWSPDAGGAGRARVNVALRTSHAAPRQWLLLAGGALTSRTAARALWNGAGTGPDAWALLRAHPLSDGDGVIRSDWWAPRLASATLEVRQWLTRLGPIDVGVAAFIDGALAGGGSADAAGRSAARGAVDGGLGLRLRLDGAGVLRFDAAHGLGNRARAFSISLEAGTR